MLYKFHWLDYSSNKSYTLSLIIFLLPSILPICFQIWWLFSEIGSFLIKILASQHYIRLISNLTFGKWDQFSVSKCAVSLFNKKYPPRSAYSMKKNSRFIEKSSTQWNQSATLKISSRYLSADVADVRFVSGVDPDVDLQVEVPLEGLAADGAAVHLVDLVASNVGLTKIQSL